jgi:hypothetical protein
MYLAVLDPGKEDFKPSANSILDRADAFVLRNTFPKTGTAWPSVSSKLLQSKPTFLQQEGEAIPTPLVDSVRNAFSLPATTRI